jgi:hypothetical protein
MQTCNERHRHSAVANQAEVVLPAKNGLSSDDFTQPLKNAVIKAFSSSVKIPILIIACFAVYYPILFNDFLYGLDDQWQMMNHHTEAGINLTNLWSIFTGFFHGQYSPVNETMYLFIYSLFGHNPMSFHLVSLLLQVGCVCLAYIIIIRIFIQSKHQITVNKSKDENNCSSLLYY